MNTPSARRFFVIRAAAFGALLCSTASVAAPSDRAVEVLGSRSPPAAAKLPDRARAGSALLGVLDGRALSAPAIELTLADGQRIKAHLERIARDDTKNTQSWIGTFEDSPGSVLVMSKAKGVVTGYANYRDQTLEILPAAGGKHLLFAVDNKRLPQTDGVESSALGGGDLVTTGTDYGTGDTTLAATNAVVQDVLVVYTGAAASKWGQGTLESMVHSAVQSGNQAYLNSQANITLHIVGLQQVGLSESGSGMQATLSALKQNTEVRSLRDKLAADMVVLVSQDSDWCGYASLQWWSSGSGTTYDAYAVTYSSCLSNQTLAHELGHLQGLDHNRENAGNSAAYPYSYGYRVCGSSGFLDIMSYQCSSSTPRILNFSNPYVTYNGYPTGISYEANAANSAETARTLNDTATRVAAYRVASTSAATVPVAPSGLAVQSSTYNRVAIGWTDNSANEVGFKVDRSGDGVSFIEIATLGADARNFADTSVTARTTYYYRVRAYNSIGASNFSNVVNVTTPDVPPPPPAAPSSVSAGNNGDGTSLVSWSAGSTTATSFEVRREKWDSRKRIWSAPSIAASVPAHVLSIVDSTGAGTYRYSVRAVNSGGASGYAGPAMVTVTSSSSGSTKKNTPKRGS